MQNPRLAVFVIVTASICCAPASAQDGAGSVWPTRQWQTSTPEAQGMDSGALASLLDFGASRSFDSLLIARHGRIVLDAYYAPYTAELPHAINSSTKAVIGTLTAIAVRDGLLDSLDHRMLDFFGDRSIANLDDDKKAITIQSLLDMTSGIDWTEPADGGRPDTLIQWDHSRDLIQFVLDRPMAHAPGEVFNYDSGNPHLLSAILTRLAGTSTWDYAKAKLFGPLGISVSSWRHDPQGLTLGGGGLALLPRDAAKIGYLYLHHGEWEDKPLIPAAWVDRMSQADVNMHVASLPELRYANFFWALPARQVYMGVGYHCQLIMVFPQADMVAVTTARAACPLGKVADHILAAVKSGTALPPDPAGARQLAEKIHDIATEKPTETGAAPEIAAAISGKSWRFPGNMLKVKSLALHLTEAQPHYQLEIYTGDPHRPSLAFSGPIGLDGLYRQGETTPFGVIALKGMWLNANAFAMDLRLLGGDGDHDRRWILSFDGGRASLRGKDSDGHEVAIDGEVGG